MPRWYEHPVFLVAANVAFAVAVYAVAELLNIQFRIVLWWTLTLALGALWLYTKQRHRKNPSGVDQNTPIALGFAFAVFAGAIVCNAIFGFAE